MRTVNDYTVIVTPNSGAFLAYIPAIDGCHALGNTPEDARRELEFVFEMISEAHAEAGKPLPGDISADQLLAVG